MFGVDVEHAIKIIWNGDDNNTDINEVTGTTGEAVAAAGQGLQRDSYKLGRSGSTRFRLTAQVSASWRRLESSCISHQPFPHPFIPTFISGHSCI